MLRIVSTGGLAMGTKVYQDGVELENITAVTIHPLEIGAPVQATITFVLVELDIEAEQVRTPPPPPAPPPARHIRDYYAHTCPRCHSSARRRWWLFGPLLCIRPGCAGETEASQ